MNIVIKFLLFLSLIGAFYFVGNALYSSNTNLQLFVSHISSVFNMVAGNMKNLKEVFPVYDAALGFGAIITTELIMVGIKIAKFFIKPSQQ
jgi:hypothetical protein